MVGLRGKTIKAVRTPEPKQKVASLKEIEINSKKDKRKCFMTLYNC